MIKYHCMHVYLEIIQLKHKPLEFVYDALYTLHNIEYVSFKLELRQNHTRSDINNVIIYTA